MMKKIAILALVASAAFSNALAATCDIELSGSTTFTGNPVKPAVVRVTCGSADYTNIDEKNVSYSKNINVGEGTVSVKLPDGTTAETNFTIKKKSIYIQTENCEKEKGAEDPEFTWHMQTVENLQADSLANLKKALSSVIKLERVAGEEIEIEPGTPMKYYITFADGLAEELEAKFPNYRISQDKTKGYLTITKTKINIVVKSGAKIYGADDPKFTYSKQNNSGKNVSVSEDVLGKIVLTRASGENAGSYRIKVKIDGKEYEEKPAVVEGCEYPYCKETDDYYIYVIWGTLVIQPATATVTVDDVSKVYGEITPEFTYTVDGLVGKDVLKDVTLSCTDCSADDLENVDEYPITASVKAASNPNYKVTVKAGTLKVTQKAATVSVKNVKKTYGDADPKFTYETSGLVRENESLEFATVSRVKGENVGPYKINVTFAKGANPNYTVTVKPGTLTIEPRPVVLTVTDLSKKFGEKDPALTYSVETLASFDGVEAGLKDVELSREKGENAGEYAISVTVDETMNPNYIITIAEGGTFSILPNDDDIVVTVKGNSKTVEYDGKEKTVKDYEISSNKEAYSLQYVKFTGKASVSGKDAGTYPMGLATENFENTSENYKKVSFVVEDGVLEITPRSVVVTAKADTITYGEAIPTDFAWTVDKLVKGEELDNIHVSVEETGILPAGDYALVFDQQSPTNKNYVVSKYVTDKLTVKKKTLTITVDNAEKIYSEPDPAKFTYTVSGLVEGDAEPTVTTAREPGENVLKTSKGEDSTYRISATLSIDNPNYLLKVKQGKFTIKPYPKRITVAIFGEDVVAKYTGEEIAVAKKYDVSLIPMDGEGLPEGFSYSKDFVSYKGDPEISATEMGRFPMGLVADDFVNISPNFEHVSFNVTVDGELVIDEEGPRTSIGFVKPVKTLGISVNNRRILVSGSKVGERYTVYDMQGNVVRMGSVESASFEIPVSNAGIYMVRVGASVERIRVK